MSQNASEKYLTSSREVNNDMNALPAKIMAFYSPRIHWRELDDDGEPNFGGFEDQTFHYWRNVKW